MNLNMMIHRVLSKDEFNVGGGSNTPQTSRNGLYNTREKRVLIDWLSVTIDFIPIDRDANGTYHIDVVDPRFRTLLRILNNGRETYTPGFVVNNYRHSKIVGEHTKLLYGNEITKTAAGDYTLNIVMNGHACREFEHINKGSWHELFVFLLSNGIVNVARLDIAIDDFDGQELDVYDLLPFIQKGYYVSPLSKFDIRVSGKKINSKKSRTKSSGLTITLGSPGSNQLQIYDKKLERSNKNQPDMITEIWYRYEMRFVHEKAYEILNLYTISVEQNNSLLFMKFARQLLFGMFDPKITSGNVINLSECATYPKYLDFLDSVEKIDIKVRHEIDTSLEKTARWYKKSVSSTNLNFYLAFLNEKDFLVFLYQAMIDAYDNYDEQKLKKINNFRTKMGFPMIDWKDIGIVIGDLKKKLENEDDEDDLPF